MAKDVIISNGSGTSELINGSYSVSVNSTGYDSASIDPNTVTIVEGTNSYAFTVAGNGTLTLHVTEDGTEIGTAVVGAKFKRADADGNLYGNEITTDATGNAVFEHVPYASTGAPNVYFKQISSDGEHEFSSDLITVSLSTETYTKEIQNARGVERTITLTDKNYANLPIESATITFTE